MQEPEILEREADELERVPMPGQLIRKAREHRHLSVDALAEETRLTVAVINAVERDDYSALGQPVYARGYYRKCGEALSLNVAALVDAYEKRSGTGSPIPAINQRPSIQYREGPGLMRVLVFVLLVAAFIGVSAWVLWTNPPALLKEFIDASTTSSAGAVDETAVSVATPAPVRKQPAQAVQVTPTPKPLEAVQTADSSQPEAQASVTPVAKAPSVAQRPSVPPVQTESVQTASERTLAAMPVLRIETQAQAWTDISDSTGKELVYKLLPAGSERELQGTPPYQLRLGRADAIRIWFNDQLLDLRAVIQEDKRASFRITTNGRVEG